VIHGPRKVENHRRPTRIARSDVSFVFTPGDLLLEWFAAQSVQHVLLFIYEYIL